MMETIWQDARYALRSFKQKPAFAAVVILTLALGIGANTAIFSFVNALLLTPLPYKDADRLIRVMSERGGEAGKLSMLEIDDLKRQARLFEDFASIRNTQYNVTGDGPPESLVTSVNSYNLFDLLGVKAHVGSVWPASHERQRVFAIVLGYEVWQKRFGGDPKIVGQKIMLDAAPYEVLGVMPPGFNFPLNAQLYRRVPPGDFDSRNTRESGVIARLRPNVTIAQAQGELDAIAREFEQSYPDTNTGLRLKVRPFREHYIGNAGGYLWLLLGAVGFVLLIACVNVAGLMLVRASTRTREMAVRAALGAGRWRLIRQMLTESLLLTLASAAVGLLLAVLCVDLLAGMMRFDLPAWMKIAVDARALGFTLTVSLLTGIVAGLAPAWQASKPDLNESLKEGSKGSSGGAGQRARRALVVAEVALALALMAGAGLMVTSFMKLRQTPLGFDPSSTLTIKMDPPWSKYKHVRETAPFYKRVIEEVERIPGVESAAFNDSLPLAGQDIREGSNRLSIEIEGQPADERQRNPYVNAQIVSPGYFRAMKIAAVSGRLFDTRDGQQSTQMAVVSRRVAEAFWPGQDTVGKRLKLTGRNQNYRLDSNEPDPWLTIAGVVSDVRQRGVMGAPGLDVYVCDQQLFSPESYLAVRAKVDPLTLTQAVKQAVWKADPEQSVFDVQTMEQRVLATVWQQRLAGIVLLIFAGLALALTAVGIYGVMSFAVSQRTREIGIRLAMGAQTGDVLRMVLGEGLNLALTGAGIGLLCALLLARAVSHLFYGISANDPLTFASVALLLTAVALAACWFPARRAMKVDPMIALRSE
ncbi:MAG: ABC transporter permease [Acidobacteria bacterium]|nr:ABC transporter permease [Acidobacteriota bacterium]